MLKKFYSNFNKNNLKQFLLLLVGVLILSFLSYDNYKTRQVKRISSISEINIINDDNVSPRELFDSSWSIIKSNYYNRSLNHQNWNRWKKRYINKIKTQEDAYVAINTMLASLDDSYSKFMSEEEFSAQNSAINSKLYGIGINIASVSGKIYIINVLDGAPADVAGIKSGDIILKVNNEDVNGESVYHVASLIRGTIDETLELEILRGQEKSKISLKREEIKVKTIISKKLTDDIGYIRISSFIGINTTKEFIIALNRLKETKGLILDLRGNSGGLFQNAIVISNLFMKDGIIVNVIARQGRKNVYTAQNDGCIYDNPLVVLIDGNSASASEILSSALHDNKRAVLVGTRTYGKGLVQKVFSMPNKSGMNLTIAKYLTPNGEDINNKGVEPDYIVNFSHRDFLDNVDPQLSYAQRYLEKEISGL